MSVRIDRYSMSNFEVPICLAAGGDGSRMRSAMDGAGYRGIPKHLLPTGRNDGSTLLGRNLRIARASGEPLVLLANAQNCQAIQEHPDISLHDVTVLDTRIGIFGPFAFIEYARREKMRRVASGAGDVYVEGFSWADLLAHHQNSSRPITFAVGRVCAGKDSAVFNIGNDGVIEGFRRLEAAADDVYRNIGLYAVTLSEPVVEIIDEFGQVYRDSPDIGRQDEVAHAFIGRGLVGAYFHAGPFINVNRPEDYQRVLDTTAQQTAA